MLKFTMPRTRFIILVALFAVIIAALGAYAFVKFKNPAPKGILVRSTPLASVYLDGKYVGKTPYGGISTQDAVDLKLIPDDASLPTYETKVGLVSGVKTVVNREFGKSEEESSEEIVSFDKSNGESAGIVAISTPGGSKVYIDDIYKGTTPFSLDNAQLGAHKLEIKSDGYVSKVQNIIITKGFRLSFFAKLSKVSTKGDVSGVSTEQNASESASVSRMVKIGNTPTGFLRMRTLPGTKGEEIAELKPGEEYKYLEIDEETSWYKIQYKNPVPGLPNGITGWVSNQYSELSTSSAEVR